MSMLNNRITYLLTYIYQAQYNAVTYLLLTPVFEIVNGGFGWCLDIIKFIVEEVRVYI